MEMMAAPRKPVVPPLNDYAIFLKIEYQRILVAGGLGLAEDGSVLLPPPRPISELEVRHVLKEHHTRRRRAHRRGLLNLAVEEDISLDQISRALAQRWNCLDLQSRRILHQQAQRVKEDYRREVRAWRETNNRYHQHEGYMAATSWISVSPRQRNHHELYLLQQLVGARPTRQQGDSHGRGDDYEPGGSGAPSA
eukprot:CAMPEP_0172443952 /NCGR_PEP_ID=MMETSP1065-20121228/4132_1 /TAXON_ID=265537 /ORGANISM="Amphiprora paludosa, Strain CCMP125" /LENGTH=193 /DNA_ID=CAMNT_0013194365 /DNA_START=105 /DNA_END=686 /DNA_ORIENTATION=+